MNDSTPQLTIRISWFGMLNYLGALITTGWVLYLLYGAAGVMYTLLALLIFGLILRFGASPLFAISASILFFHFDVAGLWLPLLAYAIAGIAFYKDLQKYRARQTNNP